MISTRASIMFVGDKTLSYTHKHIRIHTVQCYGIPNEGEKKVRTMRARSWLQIEIHRYLVDYKHLWFRWKKKCFIALLSSCKQTQWNWANESYNLLTALWIALHEGKICVDCGFEIFKPKSGKPAEMNVNRILVQFILIFHSIAQIRLRFISSFFLLWKQNGIKFHRTRLHRIFCINVRVQRLKSKGGGRAIECTIHARAWSQSTHFTSIILIRTRFKYLINGILCISFILCFIIYSEHEKRVFVKSAKDVSQIITSNYSSVGYSENTPDTLTARVKLKRQIK